MSRDQRRLFLGEASPGLRLLEASSGDRLPIARWNDGPPVVGEVAGFTVPAINLRAQTFDMARTAFEAASSAEVGAVIFEIARSEIGYSEQRPGEYAAGAVSALPFGSRLTRLMRSSSRAWRRKG